MSSATYSERSSSSASALDAWYSRAETSWSIAVSRRQRWHGPCSRPTNESSKTVPVERCVARNSAGTFSGTGEVALAAELERRELHLDLVLKLLARPELQRPKVEAGHAASVAASSSTTGCAGGARLRPHDQHDGRDDRCAREQHPGGDRLVQEDRAEEHGDHGVDVRVRADELRRRDREQPDVRRVRDDRAEEDEPGEREPRPPETAPTSSRSPDVKPITASSAPPASISIPSRAAGCPAAEPLARRGSRSSRRSAP